MSECHSPVSALSMCVKHGPCIWFQDKYSAQTLPTTLPISPDRVCRLVLRLLPLQLLCIHSYRQRVELVASSHGCPEPKSWIFSTGQRLLFLHKLNPPATGSYCLLTRLSRFHLLLTACTPRLPCLRLCSGEARNQWPGIHPLHRTSGHRMRRCKRCCPCGLALLPM